MLRTFCSEWNGDCKVPGLSREELHHLIRVRRVRIGEHMEILNGRGAVLSCAVKAIDGRNLELDLLKLDEVAPPVVRTHLLVAVPKGKAFPNLLHKAVELGVAEITPLISENAELNVDRADDKAGRWESVLVEAVKQSGNPWLPRLNPPCSLESWLQNKTGQGGLSLCAALQPDARPLLDVLEDACPKSGVIEILIGPEGDFSQQEYSLMKAAGCRFVSLGPLVLKVETAASLAVGCVALFRRKKEI